MRVEQDHRLWGLTGLALAPRGLPHGPFARDGPVRLPLPLPCLSLPRTRFLELSPLLCRPGRLVQVSGEDGLVSHVAENIGRRRGLDRYQFRHWPAVFGDHVCFLTLRDAIHQLEALGLELG